MPPRRTLGVVVPLGRHRVDEGLVVSLLLAGGDERRLAVRLAGELRCVHVWNPDLDRAQALLAQSLSMLWAIKIRPCPDLAQVPRLAWLRLIDLLFWYRGWRDMRTNSGVVAAARCQLKVAPGVTPRIGSTHFLRDRVVDVELVLGRGVDCQRVPDVSGLRDESQGGFEPAPDLAVGQRVARASR